MAGNQNEKINLDGKVIIVTGANTGIGYETALDLAHKGAYVILACRDQSRGEAAVEKIKIETKSEKVRLELVDLGDFDSVRDFAKRIIEKETRLDILINNAAVIPNKLTKNKNGIELQFAVNHLGHFLLTNLLLDLLKKSAPSRIINVSSMAYKMGRINWNDLNSERNYTTFRAYSQTKLANIYFTIELARRLQGSNVTTVSLHPGAVKTEISRDYTGVFKCIVNLFSSCLKTPKQGAATTLYCALDPSIQNHAGEYFSDSRPNSLSRSIRESTDIGKLWDVSAKMVSLY